MEWQCCLLYRSPILRARTFCPRRSISKHVLLPSRLVLAVHPAKRAVNDPGATRNAQKIGRFEAAAQLPRNGMRPGHRLAYMGA